MAGRRRGYISHFPRSAWLVALAATMAALQPSVSAVFGRWAPAGPLHGIGAGGKVLRSRAPHPCRRGSCSRRSHATPDRGGRRRAVDSSNGGGNGAAAVGSPGSWGASYLPNPPDLFKLAFVLVPPAMVRWPGYEWHASFVVAFPAYLALMRRWPGPSWLGGSPWVPEVLSAAQPDVLRSPLAGVASGSTYRGYVSCGAVLGVLLPLALLAWRALCVVVAAVRQQPAGWDLNPAAALAIAHTFWLFAQIQTEDYHRRQRFPQLLRVMVPIVYNTLRIPVLWAWFSAALHPAVGAQASWPMLFAAAGNLFFWTFNLLFFLLPVAMRAYAKAYFHELELPRGGRDGE